MSKATSNDLEFSMVENALHSMTVAVGFINAPTHDIKIAVLLLGQGMELLLKARLQKEHWSLIFADPKDASLKKFKAGDLKTATFQDCLDRLEKVANVTFTADAVATIRRLRERRNQMEHFNVSDNIRAAQSEACRVLSIALDFVREQLEGDRLKGEGARYLGELRAGITTIKEMDLVRWNDIRSKIDAAKGRGVMVVPCAACLHEAASVQSEDDDVFYCEFCHMTSEPEDVADSLVRERAKSMPRKDLGSAGPPYPCFACEALALMEGGFIGDAENMFVCLGCRGRWKRLSQCASCTVPLRPGSIDTACSDCLREYREYDDRLV